MLDVLFESELTSLPLLGRGKVRDIYAVGDQHLLIVTTDHGLAMPRAKCTLYDPGIEALLLMRYPGRLESGTRYPQLVSNVDVLPSLLEALGAEIKKSWELYKEKVTPEVANGSNHFRDALNDILADGEKIF